MPITQALANTFLLMSALAPAPAAAQDKSAYSLFNPTPAAQMREMSTDRPDQTESAYTVDAGHIQLETDLWSRGVDRSRDAGQDLRTIDNAYGSINVKLGLTNSTDIQIILAPYLDTLTRDLSSGAVVGKNHGFGDVTARLKVNLWGNDGGDTAMAVMPFVKLPASSNAMGNRYVEGGVILPLALRMVDGLDICLMTEVDAVRNSADTGYAAAFVNTATVGFELADRIGMYTEIATAISTEAGTHWDVTADAGLTFALSDSLRLDAGVNVGLTRAARDLNPFVGLSWRF